LADLRGGVVLPIERPRAPVKFKRRRRDIAVETSAPSHRCRTYGARKIIGASQLQRCRTYGAAGVGGTRRRVLTPPARASMKQNRALDGAAWAAGNAGVRPTFNAVTADYSPGAVPIPPYQTAVYIIRVK